MKNFTFINTFLDSITMYKLMVDVLLFLIGVSMVLGYFGFLPYSPLSILLSAGWITLLCWATNMVFAAVYKTPANAESYLITALILVLILPPIESGQNLALPGWAAILSMASKYILSLKKKHIFNPAAAAVYLTSVGFGGSANWWVGNAYLAPFVLIGGLLIVKKLNRWDLVIANVATVIAVGIIQLGLAGGDVAGRVQTLVLSSSLLFFAGYMLTEPLTMPPTRKSRLVYGSLAGLLFLPTVHIGNVYTTPESALILANIYSYLASPKEKLWLALKEKIRISPDTFDFIFYKSPDFAYVPGQYMEWTLPPDHTDSRGNRRFFTLASSPTENTLRIGVKFADSGSSFKKDLYNLPHSIPIVASQLSGEFILPQNVHQPVVFIAGGIGVTPFRSMVRYLVDRGEARPVTLLYSGRQPHDILYRETFDEAARRLGIKVVYTVTDPDAALAGWKGNIGRIDTELIRRHVPDYNRSIFYLSGSYALVHGMEQTLAGLGIAQNRIKKDYFPGFIH